jgi:hypothetical protein
MFLRHARWLVASLATIAGIVLAPARSDAGIQVLIEELDASSNVVGTPGYFTGTPSGTLYSQAFTFSGSQFSILSGSAITNSASSPAIVPASLSANFGIGVLVDNPTDTLRITVTDDGYSAGHGLPAVLRNTASVSIATDAAAQVDSFSRLLATPLTFPGSSTQPPDSTTLGGPTPTATDVRPDTLGVSPVTTALVSSLPDHYALQQVIIISIPPGVNTPQGTSFNGTAGVTATPVPAPGGLALALVGLPLLGLRRVFRKRTAA